ncbi:MAG: pyridoxal-phosphate dependent enzyme, partial [Candidatus Lokiarchaeota archaeon]|nr:pyridoxal-phosphate dependent enzyme [Candidatus Lokiarchaeota archaeon]
IKGLINHTPVMTSRTLNKMINAEVFLKCENFQRVGAFKFRGASNKLLLLSDEQKERGVVTHSSGNHAQAVSLASSLLGINSVIVMPDNAPQVKVKATKDYGAKVVRCESTVTARVKTCQELINKHGYTLIHPYDDDQIIAGAGTAAYELIEEIGDINYIFCPVGGGGLISGNSIATKGCCPNACVIGVEPEEADDAFRSIRDNKLYPSVYPNTIADGLRTSLSQRTFNIIKKYVDKIITVTEEEILDAMRFLWERMKIVVEPSGVVPVAGIMKMKEDLQNKKVGAILSGGNLDLDPLFNNYEKKIQSKSSEK